MAGAVVAPLVARKAATMVAIIRAAIGAAKVKAVVAQARAAIKVASHGIKQQRMADQSVTSITMMRSVTVRAVSCTAVGSA